MSRHPKSTATITPSNDKFFHEFPKCYLANLPLYYRAFLETWFAPNSQLRDKDILRVGGSIAELFPADLKSVTEKYKLKYHERSNSTKTFGVEAKAKRDLWNYLQRGKFSAPASQPNDIDLITTATLKELVAVFGPDNVKLSPLQQQQLVTIRFRHGDTFYPFDVVLRPKLHIHEDRRKVRLGNALYEHITKDGTESYSCTLTTYKNTLGPFLAAANHEFIPTPKFENKLNGNPTGILYIVKQSLKHITIPLQVLNHVTGLVDKNNLNLIDNPDVFCKHLQRLFSIRKLKTGYYDFVSTWDLLTCFGITYKLFPFSIDPNCNQIIKQRLIKLQHEIEPGTHFSFMQICIAIIMPELAWNVSTNCEYEIDCNTLSTYINPKLITSKLYGYLDELVYPIRCASIIDTVVHALESKQLSSLDRETLNSFFRKPIAIVTDKFFEYMKAEVKIRLTPKLNVHAALFVPAAAQPRCESATSNDSRVSRDSGNVSSDEPQPSDASGPASPVRLFSPPQSPIPLKLTPKPPSYASIAAGVKS